MNLEDAEEQLGLMKMQFNLLKVSVEKFSAKKCLLNSPKLRTANFT